MKKIIHNILNDSIEVKKRSVKKCMPALIEGADLIAMCMASGHKILIFGNGGSAADAQHFAAEFVNRFQIERPALAAIALTTDTSILTSIGNDYCFDEIFARQIRALGKKDDIAWGISTSGNSNNVVKAIETAREIGLHTIGMSGRNGKLANSADIVYRVESDATARIQEVHIVLGHILCDLVEKILFSVPTSSPG